LWKTAKPFLERWLKEQMGPLAMLRQVKDKLPFWAEKLPEMPDLLHQFLQQQPKQQQQLMNQLQQWQAHQRQQRQQLVGAIVAGAGFLCATLLLTSGWTWLATAAAVAAAVMLTTTLLS